MDVVEADPAGDAHRPRLEDDTDAAKGTRARLVTMIFAEYHVHECTPGCSGYEARWMQSKMTRMD